MKRAAQLLAALVLLLSGAVTFLYCNPLIHLGVFEAVDPEGDYVETPALVSATYLSLPEPPWIVRHMKEFHWTNETVIQELYNDYTTPRKIDCTVETRGSQTIVTYDGSATDLDGRPVPYHRQLCFDFILTKDVS